MDLDGEKLLVTVELMDDPKFTKLYEGWKAP